MDTCSIVSLMVISMARCIVGVVCFSRRRMASLNEEPPDVTCYHAITGKTYQHIAFTNQ